jgi:hypothetical protein
MNHPEQIWRAVRSTPQEDGGRVKVLSTVVDGVRVYREEYFGAPSPDGMRSLTGERYYTTNPDRAHSTLGAALAAATAPVERNEP